MDNTLMSLFTHLANEGSPLTLNQVLIYETDIRFVFSIILTTFLVDLKVWLTYSFKEEGISKGTNVY